MLVTSETNSGPPSRTPSSILDSPTLARVERARLRLEAAAANASNQNSIGMICNINNRDQREDSLERSILDPAKQSLLAGRIPIASMTGPIKRGLLWQQRDRLFSRWKERYFVLTRDYLHCFKRASGSAAERISDMGQFIFKVKLVDVEKVEWLNRRSYSVIGLLLGREGRVLLRCDHGLEDWFELLEECTLTSKERRRALKITQGPRSRASLAAPPSHTSLQNHHYLGLGSTYSSALDDWLMTHRHRSLNSAANPFIFSDSVPDLSTLNNENHHNINNSGLSTNHSTPKRIPYSSNPNGYNSNNGSINGIYNTGRYLSNFGQNNNNINNNNNSNSNSNLNTLNNGFYGSPRRILINNFGSNNVVDEEDESEVQLRRPQIIIRQLQHDNIDLINNDNGNNDKDWMYRKPKGPNDNRYSATTTDLDYSACDSGLDTPPSTHRPSSYRDINNHHNHNQPISPRDSTETTVSSSRGTMQVSPGSSFRANHHHHYQQQQQQQQQQQYQQQQQHISHHQYITSQQQQIKKQQQQQQQQQPRSPSIINNALNSMNNAINGSRYSIQDRILKIRNEEDHNRSASIKSANRLNHNELYDPNQNRCYYKINEIMTTNNTTLTQTGGITTTTTPTSSGSPTTITTSPNNGNNSSGSGIIYRERYQHPALAAIINEAQGMKFRDRSYSDCQQFPRRTTINNNHPSPSPRRAAFFGTPTRV